MREKRIQLLTIGIFLLLLVNPASILALEIKVEILNRKKNDSVIQCAIFENEKGFPTENKEAVKRAVADLMKDGKTRCIFQGMDPKKYAVSVHEDLNGNLKMDSTFVGFPLEPWGVSNNAPARTFGPPTFESARFNASSEITISIRLNQPENQ